MHYVLVGKPRKLLEDLVGEERRRDDVFGQSEVAHAVSDALFHELVPKIQVPDHGRGEGDVQELELDLWQYTSLFTWGQYFDSNMLFNVFLTLEISKSLPFRRINSLKNHLYLIST